MKNVFQAKRTAHTHTAIYHFMNLYKPLKITVIPTLESNMNGYIRLAIISRRFRYCSECQLVNDKTEKIGTSQNDILSIWKWAENMVASKQSDWIRLVFRCSDLCENSVQNVSTDLMNGLAQNKIQSLVCISNPKCDVIKAVA